MAFEYLKMENNNSFPHELFPNKLTQKPLMNQLLELTNTFNLLIWKFGMEREILGSWEYYSAQLIVDNIAEIKLNFKILSGKKKHFTKLYEQIQSAHTSRMTDHVHIWNSKWMRPKDTCGVCLPHHSGFAMLINEGDCNFHNVLFHVSNQKFAAPKQHVSAYLGYFCNGLLPVWISM